MRHARRLPLASALLLLAIASGCVSQAPAPPPPPAESAPAKPPATAPAPAPSELVGSHWQLLGFRGGDGTTLSADPGRYTLEFASDGSVSVRFDCNRGRGAWTSPAPGQLTFGPLALTRAKCPAAPLTDRLPIEWTWVRSYVLRDGHLFLALMADGGIYEFAPMP